MFEYLSPADGPVVVGLEKEETVFAEDQPEYKALRALRSRDRAGRVLTRWPLTAEQRQAIANGADLFVEVVTFNQPLQPIAVAVVDEVNPLYIRHTYNLPIPIVRMVQ